MTMLGTFVPIERVSYRFGRHIRCHCKPRHEWLRPRAIGAFPIWRFLRGRQNPSRRSRRISHTPTLRSFLPLVPAWMTFMRFGCKPTIARALYACSRGSSLSEIFRLSITPVMRAHIHPPRGDRFNRYSAFHLACFEPANRSTGIAL